MRESSLSSIEDYDVSDLLRLEESDADDESNEDEEDKEGGFLKSICMIPGCQ